MPSAMVFRDSRVAPARRMRLAAFAAVSALTLMLAPAAAFEKVKVGDTLPGFSLPDTAGGTVSAADLAGKAVVLVFFKHP